MQVLSHSESKSLIFSAHEDKLVKYWDVNSGRCAYVLTAHEDAVTSISLDPHSTRHFATVCTFLCLFLCPPCIAHHYFNAAHDASLRFWNLAQRACTQEIPSVGLRKADMALHAVSLSPFKLPLAAVACADGTVKLYT